MLTGTGGYFGFICTEGMGDGGFLEGGGSWGGIFSPLLLNCPPPLK